MTGEPLAERPAMRDYGVPAGADGVLPWSWAWERLGRSRNFWVATADASGRPHALPVWGVWVHPGQFFFSCAPSSRKARNLAANPAIVVAADDTVEVVSVQGRAARVEGASAEPGVAAYVAKYAEPGQAATLADFVRSHAMFAVAPERAIGLIERPGEFAERATRWRWPDPAGPA